MRADREKNTTLSQRRDFNGGRAKDDRRAVNAPRKPLEQRGGHVLFL